LGSMLRQVFYGSMLRNGKHFNKYFNLVKTNISILFI
jgi:hypothetical protein